MKALVVENDLKSQCLLAKVLAERGHEVTTFENAEQAILAYQRDFYPLLFVDVGLPGMDGLQYCRWIRSQPCGERSYVIAAIEPTLPAEVQQVLAAGANDFLTKPYQLDQLRARLVIGERQMSQFFNRQQLEESLQSETQRWTMAEAELFRTREEFELLLGAKDSELNELREKVHATEQALESANLEQTRLRGVQAESTDSLKETLKRREQELACLERELMETREALSQQLGQHTEQLVKLREQMRVSVDDRKRDEVLQRLKAEPEETNRLRRALAAAQERVAVLEDEQKSAMEELRVHRDARKRLETRWRTALCLGAELNRATTAEDVARVAGLTTQELVGWDRFSFDAYVAEGDWIHPVLNLESVDGRACPARPLHPGPQPGSLLRRVLEDGPQLILRPVASCNGHDAVVVGNRARKSASLLCVPMTMVGRIVGFLTVRSSVENAYRVDDLAMLEMLAAHCAGALERIEARSVCENNAVREPAPRSELAVQVGS